MAEVFSEPRAFGSGYVLQSRYHYQLVRFLEHFDLDRILVVDHDDLLHRRRDTLRHVFRFLGVDEGFTSPRFAMMRNTSSERLPGSAARNGARRLLRRMAGPATERAEAALVRSAPRPAIEERLRHSLVGRFFEDDVARLRDLTGQRFGSWRV